jgi:hypothetical protein
MTVVIPGRVRDGRARAAAAANIPRLAGMAEAARKENPRCSTC